MALKTALPRWGSSTKVKSHRAAFLDPDLLWTVPSRCRYCIVEGGSGSQSVLVELPVPRDHAKERDRIASLAIARCCPWDL